MNKFEKDVEPRIMYLYDPVERIIKKMESMKMKFQFLAPKRTSFLQSGMARTKHVLNVACCYLERNVSSIGEIFQFLYPPR